ncbi:unnamed protein product [Nippostrongylus brasiliensis]|uniref:Uncharacterized protein n=1 Tax=Nippostrongylus brasiliensis TaxID=27835 RepID=A0A158QXT3_NIPBR|nr:unnamed protein product [Nippostrongylus brasiliensis]
MEEEEIAVAGSEAPPSPTPRYADASASTTLPLQLSDPLRHFLEISESVSDIDEAYWGLLSVYRDLEGDLNGLDRELID